MDVAAGTRLTLAPDRCRKTGREESPPREEEAEMPVGSTPALVSSGFKRRQALKAVEVGAGLAWKAILRRVVFFLVHGCN